MKKFYLFVFMFLGFIDLCNANAQSSKRYIITFIAEIPLMIESGIYSRELSAKESFITVSGRLRIALAPRGKMVQSDHLFQTGNPLKKEQIAQIEYRYFINQSAVSKWQKLHYKDQKRNTFPHSGLLIDTVLRIAEKLTIQFRFKTKTSIIQQHIFNRPQLIPIISAYRCKQPYNSVDNDHTAKAVASGKDIISGFNSLQTTSINVTPGKYPEFLINKRSLNKDSCIFYRVRNAKDRNHSDWILTGHLIALPQIKAGQQYQLDIKYAGTDIHSSYEVIALPFWYQTSIAKSLILASSVTTLLGATYSLYQLRLRKERQKLKQALSQLKTVQSQLNPHFVFNALNSIEGLITNKENRKANEYLSSFADIMRATLKNSGHLLISLSQEIDILEKYIRIEQLRFEFQYNIIIDPALNLQAIEFPPMLLQPSVENAVKHGVAGMGNAGNIIIVIGRRGNSLEIDIQDNGKRFYPSDKQKSGYGILFTKERIAYLKKLYKKEKITYNLVHADSGTSVRFFFENWLA